MPTQANIVKHETNIQPYTLQQSILMLRGKQVLMDYQLAELYGVETKRLNEAVKRNIQRFPEDFMFRVSKEELAAIRSQIATTYPQQTGNQSISYPTPQTPHAKRTSSALPYAFTEQDELDNIYAAIGALSIKHQEPPKPRNPIGFR